MNGFFRKKITFKIKMPPLLDIDQDQPIFPISAAADMLGIKPRMLRFYEERGIIAPRRTSGKRRLYSMKEIDILAYVHYLTVVKGVNVAGVLEIQRILKRMKLVTREAFMKEIRDEIASLSGTEKQRYQGNISLNQTEILEFDAHDSKNLSDTHSPVPVDLDKLSKKPV